MTSEQYRLLLRGRKGEPKEPKLPKPRQRKPKEQLPENVLEAQVLSFMQIHGWYAVRLLAGTFRTLDGHRVVSGAKKGTCDWIFLRNDRYILVETKAKRGRPEPSQLQWRMLADALGLRHVEVRRVEDLASFARRI